VNPFTNSGTSVYYFQPRSIRLARELDRALVTEFRVRDLGSAGRLRAGTTHLDAAALTEGLFVMLPEQEAVLASEDGQWRYARGWSAGSRTSYASGHGSRNNGNVECGMRNCRGGPARRLDPSLTLRIPHSAFRILFLLLLASRAEAQVDPSGTWRTLHTPHFRIHFRPPTATPPSWRRVRRSGPMVARHGAAPAPRRSGHHPGGRHRRRQRLTTVAPTNRITIFAAPPAGDHGLLFFDSWLRLVTTHELAHVFHLDRSRGLWDGLQRVFGRAPGLFPNEYQPSWVTEGLATYYESKFTNAGRVRGASIRSCSERIVRRVPRGRRGTRRYSPGGRMEWSRTRTAAASFIISPAPWATRWCPGSRRPRPPSSFRSASGARWRA